METDQVESEDLAKITFRIPRELRKRFNIALIRDGKSAQELLEGVVNRYVEKAEGEAQ